MKIILQKVLLSAWVILGFTTVGNAQVKIGSNSNNISNNTNLELEATDATRFVIKKSNGNVGIGTTSPAAELHVAGTGALIVPVGTFAQRPANAVQGMIRFNTTIGKFEGYDGSVWVALN